MLALTDTTYNKRLYRMGDSIVCVILNPNDTTVSYTYTCPISGEVFKNQHNDQANMKYCKYNYRIIDSLGDATFNDSTQVKSIIRKKSLWSITNGNLSNGDWNGETYTLSNITCSNILTEDNKGNVWLIGTTIVNDSANYAPYITKPLPKKIITILIKFDIKSKTASYFYLKNNKQPFLRIDDIQYRKNFITAILTEDCGNQIHDFVTVKLASSTVSLIQDTIPISVIQTYSDNLYRDTNVGLPQHKTLKGSYQATIKFNVKATDNFHTVLYWNANLIHTYIQNVLFEPKTFTVIDTVNVLKEGTMVYQWNIGGKKVSNCVIHLPVVVTNNLKSFQSSTIPKDTSLWWASDDTTYLKVYILNSKMSVDTSNISYISSTYERYITTTNCGGAKLASTPPSWLYVFQDSLKPTSRVFKLTDPSSTNESFTLIFKDTVPLCSGEWLNYDYQGLYLDVTTGFQACTLSYTLKNNIKFQTSTHDDTVIAGSFYKRSVLVGCESAKLISDLPSWLKIKLIDDKVDVKTFSLYGIQTKDTTYEISLTFKDTITNQTATTSFKIIAIKSPIVGTIEKINIKESMKLMNGLIVCNFNSDKVISVVAYNLMGRQIMKDQIKIKVGNYKLPLTSNSNIIYRISDGSNMITSLVKVCN